MVSFTFPLKGIDYTENFTKESIMATNPAQSQNTNPNQGQNPQNQPNRTGVNLGMGGYG
jgi:hypothetical protein